MEFGSRGTCCLSPCCGPSTAPQVPGAHKSLQVACHPASLPQTRATQSRNRASAFLSSHSRPASTLTPGWTFPHKLRYFVSSLPESALYQVLKEAQEKSHSSHKITPPCRQIGAWPWVGCLPATLGRKEPSSPFHRETRGSERRSVSRHLKVPWTPKPTPFPVHCQHVQGQVSRRWQNQAPATS